MGRHVPEILGEFVKGSLPVVQLSHLVHRPRLVLCHLQQVLKKLITAYSNFELIYMMDPSKPPLKIP